MIPAVTDSRRAERAREAETATCPVCAAAPGEACTYEHAVRGDETGLFLRWERFPRSPHQARTAVATGGAVYGYALRGLERTCRCTAEDRAAGRHPRAVCPWHPRDRPA
jgi:hypothetical protein